MQGLSMVMDRGGDPEVLLLADYLLLIDLMEFVIFRYLALLSTLGSISYFHTCGNLDNSS